MDWALQSDADWTPQSPLGSFGGLFTRRGPGVPPLAVIPFAVVAVVRSALRGLVVGFLLVRFAVLRSALRGLDHLLIRR